MAGLDQLQTQDYQANMPDYAKEGMSGLNAIYDWNQQQQLARQRQDANQVNDLQGAVAQSQNTPQGIATLASGQQGLAQTQAASGQVDQAQALSKITQAHIDDVIDKFNLYHTKAQTNPALSAAGTSWIDDHEVKAAVDSYMKTTGKTALDSLSELTDNVNQVKNAKTEQESLAKGASSQAVAKIVGSSRVESAGIRADATVDAAKIRSEFAASKSAKDLDSVYMTNTAKLANTFSVESAKAQQISLVDPDAGKIAMDSAAKNYQDAKNLIDAQYKDHQKRIEHPAAASPSKITPEEFNTKWATIPSGQSLVGPDGKSYTKR